jgi:hypothetical protein
VIVCFFLNPCQQSWLTERDRVAGSMRPTSQPCPGHRWSSSRQSAQ